MHSCALGAACTSPPLTPYRHDVAIAGALRMVGEVSGGIRRSVEAVDFFVGRYLLLTTVAYVGVKFVHYKIFDPIPF
eukprot:scaffold275923_cov33-Tisochrysis_lutea.AAC.3